MTYTKDQLNDMIREARKAVSEAEFDGLRGQAVLDLKAEVRRLQAIYARMFK